ncbi:hypothetical protein [Pseudomonas sp. TWP3-2]|uniref:hypothetical protein n=1 Tax=Pseudomonas sp. TWP3-2 TaxID=2804574 RepID=UPI003CF2F2FF
MDKSQPYMGGWRLVPLRPTPEMLMSVDDEAEDKYVARGRASSAWTSMLEASPLANHPIEPDAWLDPQSGEKCVTIGATLKRYNELAGGAPAAAVSAYSEPLFRNPTMDGRWYAADDIDSLVYQLDVLLNGEDGAADNARLCDIVAQLRAEVARPALRVTQGEDEAEKLLRDIAQRPVSALTTEQWGRLFAIINPNAEPSPQKDTPL